MPRQRSSTASALFCLLVGAGLLLGPLPAQGQDDTPAIAPISNAANKTETEQVPESGPAPLEVVFCVDCSGSMNSAMPQVRRAVAALAARALTKFPGRPARFGLVRYGDADRSFFVQDLTEDRQRFLNVVADTNIAPCGQEFVGEVIERTADKLNWSERLDAVRLLYVLGNEEVAQGPESYDKGVEKARSRGITVSMMYCPTLGEHSIAGSSVRSAQAFVTYEWEAKQQWVDAAQRGKGEFLQLVENPTAGTGITAIAWQPDKFMVTANFLYKASTQTLATADSQAAAQSMLQANTVLSQSNIMGATSGKSILRAGSRIQTTVSARDIYSGIEYFFVSHPELGGTVIRL